MSQRIIYGTDRPIEGMYKINANLEELYQHWPEAKLEEPYLKGTDFVWAYEDRLTKLDAIMGRLCKFAGVKDWEATGRLGLLDQMRATNSNFKRLYSRIVDEEAS